ncbi:MAG: S9 family peptidase [Pseudomonadota bacterium]
MPQTALIPRAVLFGNPDKMNVRLSPDGQHISFIAPYEGILNVWVGPRGDWSQAKPVTFDKNRGIRNHFWTYESGFVLYLQDQDGNEDWHLYRVNLATNSVTDLTPFENIHAQVVKTSHRTPKHILVGLNNRQPEFHDLHRLNVKTGKMELIEENNQFAGFLADWDLTPRLAMQMTSDGGSKIFKKEGKQWNLFQRIDMEDLITTSPLGFDATGQILYMQDSRDRNTSALIMLDMQSGAQTLIAKDNQADMSDALFHPTTKKVEAFASTYKRKRWQILHKEIAADFEYLKTVHPGEVEIVDRTHRDDFWVVAYLRDDGPMEYFLYEREAKQAHYLFSQNQSLKEQSLVPMQPVVIQARDGKQMVSYLSIPKDSKGPVPMVLLVHGGPTVRDTWGYNAQHQWLANRGYAVLSVNYRGSTGFGKDFIVAGYGEWAGKAHDDLVDAANWAVAEGIAEPQKVAIMGGSYGGYATLVGLTMTPEVFACGVDIVGPSNLQTLLESVPAYWTPALDMLKVRIGGDHETEEGREFLKSQSPLTYVEQITKPLLIGQGANDPRVKQAESDQIVAAMQRKAIPVTYVLYPDEGHGLARPENRLSFYAVTEMFLAQSLGGRQEAVGSDFTGSSIEIKVGDGAVKAAKSAVVAG